MSIDPARASLAGLASLLTLMLGGSAIAVKDSVVAAAGARQPRVCRVIDGDTLACQGERIRLVGVDAPEMGPCPAYRDCAPGDPLLSKYSLEAALEDGPVQVEVFGLDYYGRTLAIAWAGDTNLSCFQLGHNAAVYVPRWDKGDRIKRACKL